ncbi:class I SAM-dependent DNA methyltransferase [Pararhizobium mangrovi]|uniref:Methyltransferase domain-containing protein n=1 Tax=Pararhizobium mangrovi TaxID=2590452 RepID=A0A506UHT2_9HYPH|nr:methyltransferase domain-containing protein [Pararhizobium mangrovi]TPW32885.1 methyltransferase domain-containing protein [Pararhizobium mangrovi]
MTNTDTEQALAEAYDRALALEKEGSFDAAALAYHEVLALDPEDRAGATVRLASMGRGATPPKAPDAYVSTLFDQHAEVFDDVLVDQLGYCVPLLLRERLQAVGRTRFARLLDLGCGTGLAGGALRDMVDHATGIDLAESMVALADERDVYDDLYVGEVVDFLTEIEEPAWDLIAATDVLPYLGFLETFLAGAARCSENGAILAFSSETLPDQAFAGAPFKVGPQQRFAHAESYVHMALTEAGFTCLEAGEIVVRQESGTPTPGHLYLAERL